MVRLSVYPNCRLTYKIFQCSMHRRASRRRASRFASNYCSRSRGPVMTLEHSTWWREGEHRHLLISRSIKEIFASVTNSDGRCNDLLPPRGSEQAVKDKSDPQAGQTYKIMFKTKQYFNRTNRKTFYPWAEVEYHCISPLGFSHSSLDLIHHRKPRRTLPYSIACQSVLLYNLSGKLRKLRVALWRGYVSIYSEKREAQPAMHRPSHESREREQTGRRICLGVGNSDAQCTMEQQVDRIRAKKTR